MEAVRSRNAELTRLLRSHWSLYILGENLSGGKTPVLVGQAVSPARP